VKGIGGFHLVCDATSGDAVRRLRERKRRDEKPLRSWSGRCATPPRSAFVGPDERRLLTSPERPIVLVRKRPAAGSRKRSRPEIR
jgi:hydrogenase maturation protein HypF